MIKIKSGDVIFFKPADDVLGQIMKIGNTKAGHVGIVYSPTLDNSGKVVARLLEASNDGLRMSNVDYRLGNYAILRLKEKINMTDTQNAIKDYWYKMIADNAINYPITDLIDAGINDALFRISMGIWQKHNLLSDEKGKICSATVADIMNIILGREEFKETRVISPDDLYHNRKVFEIIKYFDEVAE